MNKLQSSLVRTKEEITCGITNIPLTKPAKVYFTVMNDNTSLVYQALESLGIEFVRQDNHFNDTSMFTSIEEIDSKTIKMIWRNFKTLHPKFLTKWRYLLWEIDNKDDNTLDTVVDMYKRLQLPFYLHHTMRGYHFISVKPILESDWKYIISNLRQTNISYPPITLRINPNKYVGEEKIFNQGFVYMPTKHNDTKQLRDWIIAKNFSRIGEQYQLVYYHIDKVKEDMEFE